MKTSRKSTTLKSLAEQLGIHVSTVSRVLNGTEEEARSAASPEVITRIRALAHKLNYRPNRQAIALKTQKTRLVGVILPRVTDLVVATIYEGIDDAALEHSYMTFVGSTLDIPERQKRLCEMALDQNVEGLIIGDARIDRSEYLDELAGKGIPLVLVSRHASPHCSVTCDDFLGGSLVAEHLLALGHKEIAILAGEPFASTGVDRTAAFIQRCKEHGISIPEKWIIHSHFDTESGHRAGEHLLRQTKKPSAIFAVNDFLAIGLMGALRDGGVQAGHDIAVVGYNDTPLAAELPISLSSVRSPMNTMGYLSMELLLQIIDGKKPDPVFLEPTLMARESSQPGLCNASRTPT